LSAVATGFVSSIVAEIFKLVPALRQNALTSALTAIVVTCIAAWVENGLVWSWVNFFACLGFACVSYLAVVQPVSKVAGFSSQL
jgi:hypothetical protein